MMLVLREWRMPAIGSSLNFVLARARIVSSITGPMRAAVEPTTRDAQLRQAAFKHVNRLQVLTGGVLSSDELAAGFQFQGERIPLVNPQRGIFKPQQMSGLLSIRTVFPRRGGRVWY